MRDMINPYDYSVLTTFKSMIFRLSQVLFRPNGISKCQLLSAYLHLNPENVPNKEK